jgi:hypothetical protein
MRTFSPMHPLAVAIALLRPSPAEVLAVAHREGDMRSANSFSPICPGPVVAVAGLIAIGLVGGLAAPFRLGARFIRGSR